MHTLYPKSLETDHKNKYWKEDDNHTDEESYDGKTEVSFVKTFQASIVKKHLIRKICALYYYSCSSFLSL